MVVVAVTGAAGFLGSHLVQLLCGNNPSASIELEEQIQEVRCLDVKNQIRELNHDKVVWFQGSITDEKYLKSSFKGVDVVFHCAALVDWGQNGFDIIEKVNYYGTKNVLDACKYNRVERLVHVSTIDVICPKNCNFINAADEELSIPDPGNFLYGAYATTKARAEALVASCDDKTLRTIIVRPTGMYGERDVYHLPNVLNAAKTGQMLVRLGGNSIQFQHTYVVNTAYGLICAARALKTKPDQVSGRAYVIVDSPSENIWDFFEPFVLASGAWMPPKWLFLPKPVAYFLAYMMMFIAFLTWPFLHWTPTLTPGALKGVLYSQSFQGNRARDDLAYHPIVPRNQAIQNTMSYFF